MDDDADREQARLDVVEHPDASDRDQILSWLAGYNASRVGPGEHRAMCILLRDDDGQAIGGLWGATFYDWLSVELLFVPESSRGRGTGAALLQRAEDEARARGCIGAWLDTFSFQARGFYERQGYQLVGSVPDHPVAGARHFMMKRWVG